MRFRQTQIAGAGLLVAVSLSASALGQQPAPIAITADRDLAFGSIAPGPAGGSVTVDPAGGRTAAGVVVLGSGFGAASYTIRISGGNPHYTITLPSSVSLLGPGAARMTVDTFVSDPAGTGKVDPSAGRIGTLAVGATLRVGPSQPSGSYSAPFLVMVNLGN
ncbi:MAG: DUF4402 domain-containing protein [Thermoanaerobaculia bacterium]|nr:DUF4402 domain-containing protein [Thermoanaerobaculia bacterium]